MKKTSSILPTIGASFRNSRSKLDSFDSNDDSPSVSKENESSTKTTKGRGTLFMSFGFKIEKTLGEKMASRGDFGPKNRDLLEVCRIETKKFFTRNRFGIIYQNLLIIMSVFSCFEYIVETYQGDNIPESLFLLEKIFAGIFSFDWLLSFFLADHKLIHITSFFSMVDLLTVIPIWITYSKECPTFSETYGNPQLLFLWVMYASNTTRILRALRCRRYVEKIDDAVNRAVGDMAITITVLILFLAALMKFLEAEAQPYQFNTWMYYIVITIATVGYGDYSPQTTLGQVLCMCMIMFAIIYVPRLTNEVIEKMSLQSVYARISYRVQGKHSLHVMLCGDVTTTSLGEFFEELFHEDHDNSELNAVILHPSRPTYDLLMMLQEPEMINVVYLEGSALISADLYRARADVAVAIFIMTNKFSDDADKEDAKTILQQLSIKQYIQLLENAKMPLFVLQLIRPENRRHLPNLGDDHDDGLMLVCLNEIKMGVMAKSLVYPGSSTLIMNLISSFADEDEDEDDEGNDHQSDVFDEGLNSESGKLFIDWLMEYKKGCDWEIYTTELSDAFNGAKFCELSNLLYQKMGIILFGLQIHDLLKPGRARLILNPADFVIPIRDGIKIEAFVIAKNKASSDLSFQKSEIKVFQVLNNLKQNLVNNVNRYRAETTVSLAFSSSSTHVDGSNETELTVAPSVNSTNINSGGLSSLINATSSTLRRGSVVAGRALGSIAYTSHDSDDVKKKFMRKNIMKTLKKTTIENAKKAFVSADTKQEAIQNLEESHVKDSYFLRKFPADINDVLIKTSITEEVPHISNHLIVVGKSLSNLYDLIRPLRARYLGTMKYIVILCPGDIPHNVWQKISIFDAILIVRGSPLEENDLIRAGMFRAKQVVVLADSIKSNDLSKSHDALVDSDSIFCYQAVKRLNLSTQVVVEIVRQSNIGYLDNSDSSQSYDEFYKFSPQFASGALFTTSLLDTLVCQSFYNPMIIKIIHKLISGVDHIDRSELIAKADEIAREKTEADKSSDDEDDDGDSDSSLNADDSMYERAINNIQCSCLYQMPIPSYLKKMYYGYLFKELALSGIIPLGLLRGTMVRDGESTLGPKLNKMAFVFTNPDKDSELYCCDRVFVLSPQPIPQSDAIDWEKDIKLHRDWDERRRVHLDTSETIKKDLDVFQELLENKLDAKISSLSSVIDTKVNALLKIIEQQHNIMRRDTDKKMSSPAFKSPHAVYKKQNSVGPTLPDI